jgi:hypothetical protein
MAEPAVLTAHFFGTFRVSVDGTPVDTASSRRTRNVLAYLLAHRRAAVPRDVLMEVFWPAAAPDAARNSLHVALTGAAGSRGPAAGRVRRDRSRRPVRPSPEYGARPLSRRS